LFAKQKTNEQSKQFFFRVIAVTWAILVRLFTSQKTNEQAPFVYFFTNNIVFLKNILAK